MAKHWAIIVGINQYVSLQPLMYAQHDALGLYHFFVHETGWPSERCHLLTDRGVGPDSPTYPSRETLQSQIQAVCGQLATVDTLWFFFSGYGVTWEGQDYLLPIDADPEQIAATGITVQSVLEQLKAVATEKVLVVLDINRSQAALPNQKLGIQSQELAKSLAVPLLLSCQPEQFSQESLAVRHGFLTAALLEGMRFHGCLTLSQLAAYITERVPELCQHHLRPPQDPEVVLPAQSEYVLVIPPEAISHLPLTQAATTTTETTLQTLSSAHSPGAADPAGAQIADSPTDASLEAGEAMAAAPEAPAEAGSSAPAAWQRWALLAAGLLLVGVFVRNQTVLTGNQPPSDAPPAEDTVPASQEDIESEGTPPQPLDQAQQALGEGRYEEALTWLAQVPKEQQDQVYTTVLEQAQVGAARAGQASQARLEQAQAQLQSLSTAPLVEAMAEAQRIPPATPNYAQAQAAIERWGRMILDVAEAQAAAGNFDAAIAAAQQLPERPPELYRLAQEQIATYQQRKVNQDVLKQAQERLVPNQPATFRDSIDLVAPIAPEYPEYATAQERIARWSEDILAIARTRAAQGDLQAAIAAAMLVPEQSSAYEPAQADIQQWQAQLEASQ